MECWPWFIEIHTLGRLVILIDGEPLRFHGKAQKKPLELLKALIAGGGQGVNLATLTQEVWPPLDGGAGENACTVTLYRLRKMLQRPDVLTFDDVRLTLDNCEA